MGRGTKPPPLLGQALARTLFTQFAQNVHSEVQIMALDAYGGRSHSQFGLSSSIVFSCC